MRTKMMNEGDLLRHYENLVSRMREDLRFLLSFVPLWARQEHVMVEEMNPFFFGTGSYEGDRKVASEVRRIIDDLDMSPEEIWGCTRHLPDYL